MPNPNDNPLAAALMAAESKAPVTPAAPAGGETPPANPPSSMADLARRKISDTPEPALEPEPGRSQGDDDPDPIESGDFPDHPAFKSLSKPSKDAPRGEHIKYAKSIGKAWRDYAKAQETEAKTRGSLISERERELDDTRKERESLMQRLNVLPELEKKAKTYEERLAAIDLEYNPEFRRKYVEPIASAETSIGEILDLAGSNKGRVLADLGEAMRETDNAKFVEKAIDAMSGAMPDAAQMLAIKELRELRRLYISRNEALSKHGSVKDILEQERSMRRREEADSYMTREYADMERSMGNAAAGIRAIVKDPAVQELLGEHKATVEKLVGDFPAVLRSSVEKVGPIPGELMSYALMGKEMIPAIFLMQAMFQEHQAMKDELSRIKESEEVTRRRLESSRGTAPRSSGPSGNDDGPKTMGELARMKMRESAV